MSFDEFGDKLDKILIDFNKKYGKDMKTIQELKFYLDKRLLNSSNKRKTLKSLKGIL